MGNGQEHATGRYVRRGGRAGIAITLVSTLFIAACAADSEPEVDQTEDPTGTDQQLELDDGYWRDPSLPEPVAETTLELPSREDSGELETGKLEVLSLDTDGDFARLVMAWLPPEEGHSMSSIVLSSHQHRYEATPFVRIVDRSAEELIEPLRGESNNFSFDQPPNLEDDEEEEEATSPAGDTEGADAPEQDDPSPDAFAEDDDGIPGRGTCICSMLSDSEDQDPERTELIFIDFPAPEADSVDIFPGEWAEPLRDVPVTSGEPFERPPESSSGFFTHASGQDPPDVYGADARHAVRHPLTARSETLSGVVTTIEEETKEVSLPSDVLFEFGSADLTDEASDVIESAADMLTEEAEGSPVTVEGHTDNVGSEELNQELSEDRAEAVAEVIADDIDDSFELETVGYGFSRPQEPNMNADGEPLPENQAQNRRVSFRYPVVVQEEGMEVDLGEAGVDDLPEAEKVATAEGALASYVLDAPEGDQSEVDIRLDILGAERADSLVTLRLNLAAQDGHEHEGAVFQGHPRRDGAQHFGHNPQGDGNSPGLSNVSIIDLETEQRYFPLSSGDRGCLCTEVAGTVEALPEQGSPMYAQFELPDELDGPVVLHIPDAGQISLPSEVVDQLVGQSSSGAEEEGDGSSE